MMLKTILALAAAAGLIAAAAALALNSQTSTLVWKHDASYGHNQPRNVTGEPRKDCIAEPITCGLVVW